MRSTWTVVAVATLSLVARASFAQGAPATEREAVPQPMSSPAATLPPGTPAVAFDSNALAGYHGGVFFLRDPDDNFRLYVQGRAQIDSYNYFGNGVADTGLKSTIFLRRIRPELTGEFLKDWQFMLAGDWGATGNDNNAGTNETSAAGPGAAPSATSGRYAGAQTATLRANPTDVFLIYTADRMFRIQGGQFDAPFTMENRTSDKFIPFMERSLAVRNVGIPSNKEMGVMFWGEDAQRYFYYSAGVFNGDGQNKINPDNRADVMARVFAHPLASQTDELRDLQIGASFRYGHRDPNYVNYDYNAFTTQGNYTFWASNYTDSNKRHVHVLPSKGQLGVAGELRVPVSDFDLTSEVVYINNQTRESVEGFQSTNTERLGAMKGYSYYVMLGYWIGKRDVNGLPGYENPTHVDLKKADPSTPPQGVQLLLKWEQMKLSYDSASRGGTADSKGIDGDIKVNALSAGVNYWATKHVRLTMNYVYNMFPDSAPTSAGKNDPAGTKYQDGSQRATAPANNLKAGINDSARLGNHDLHELLFRVAVAF